MERDPLVSGHLSVCPFLLTNQGRQGHLGWGPFLVRMQRVGDCAHAGVERPHALLPPAGDSFPSGDSLLGLSAAQPACTAGGRVSVVPA